MALALPLHLLKIELVPRELGWLPSLVFVALLLPARILVGWAMARTRRRAEPAAWPWRWLARIGLVPVALAYAGVVYLSQFTSWHGIASLYAQHAFLLPVPPLGL